MKGMTLSRALVRARVIWGKNGYVNRSRTEQGGFNCQVGKILAVGGQGFFEVKGSGPTFEEAFAVYEARERDDRIRWRAPRLYEAVKKSRELARSLLDGPQGEAAAALDNELTSLIDEIEGGA
jgi:hypothetical protein